jgi:plastocyanin
MAGRKVVLLVVGAIALAAPAAAQAATKTVFLGLPPSAEAKNIRSRSGAVNDFFPRGIAIHSGDLVKFVPVDFHTVDLIPSGGAALTAYAPTGKPVAGEHDAAGQSFWFNAKDQIFFNPALSASKFGTKVSFNGSTRLESGLPSTNKPQPVTVEFKKTGSFTYFCDIHPGMKGTVTVKSGQSTVPSSKSDEQTVKAQLRAAQKTFNAVRQRTVPPDTVSVGSAGQNGVEYYAFLQSTLTVPEGATVNFRMSAESRETHTATTGPGDPGSDPSSYLGQLAASFQGAGPFDPRAVYPSEPPASETASLTPTFHGNGFWNAGMLDASGTTPSLPPSNGVRFGTAGTYQFFCLIHPSMHAKITVTPEVHGDPVTGGQPPNPG